MGDFIVISLKRNVTGLVCLAIALAVWGCGAGENQTSTDVEGDSGGASTEPAEGTAAQANPSPNESPLTVEATSPLPQTTLGTAEQAKATTRPNPADPGNPSTAPTALIVIVEPASLDLGTAGVNESAKGTVRLVNTGDKPMTITDCKSSCGCTTTKCPKGRSLQPGESADVEVSVTTGAKGRVISKTVTFIVEGQPPLRLPVRVEVIAYVSIEPLKISPESLPDGRIVLRAIDDEPFRVLSVSPEVFAQFDEDPRVEHELFLLWDTWRDLGSEPKLSFTLDHPKVKQVQTLVRDSARSRILDKAAATRPAAARPANTLKGLDPHLSVALKNGDVQAVNEILEKGTDEKTRDDMLAVASKYGRVEMIQILLDAGANVEAPDARGRTPLMSAVQSRNGQAVQALLANGADVNAHDPDRGGTALAWASGPFGDLAMVQALLAAGADVNVSDKGGMTPLLWAAGFGDVARVETLVEAGANLQASDSTGGATPLMYAARTGSLESLHALLKAGAVLQEKGRQGKTALAWAAARGTPPKLQALIEAGADVNASDSRGWTPLDYARNRRDARGKEIVQILEPLTAREEADASESPDE
ncbi:MAG: ankyrin repeat domain-containing protein [Planctomycetota bacterium]|nr:ankyrin repeat domain-containing protein [Planctomycetota bacterium]